MFLRMQRFGLGSEVCQTFMKVHSGQPSLVMLAYCRKCCASKWQEVAKTWQKGARKTPEAGKNCIIIIIIVIIIIIITTIIIMIIVIITYLQQQQVSVSILGIF